VNRSTKFDAHLQRTRKPESRLEKFRRRSSRLASRLIGHKDVSPKKRILARLAKESDVHFIQIGSFDGETGDPLRRLIKKHRWKGVLVEPMRASFERLETLYAGCDHVVLENSAVGDRDGEVDFWYLDPAGAAVLPPWYKQISSFSKEHVLKHADYCPEIEEYVTSCRVNSITWGTLLEKHDLGRINLLHIDAEGFDYEIIKQVDLGPNRPAVILYEDVHLSDEDRAACQGLLEDAGYLCSDDGFDCIAVDSSQAHLNA